MEITVAKSLWNTPHTAAHAMVATLHAYEPGRLVSKVGNFICSSKALGINMEWTKLPGS